jgi:hypothetical protein
MWLWKVNTESVNREMEKAAIDSLLKLGRRACLNKNTMTKVGNGELVQQVVLEKMAGVFNIDWHVLQDGHVLSRPGRRNICQKIVDDHICEVLDALSAFGRLAAYRTKHDPEAIRCLAYLFEEETACLGWLGAYTGIQTYNDHARQIPSSRKVSKSEESDWFIVSRAFSRNEYVCANVNWDKAKESAFPSAKSIWNQLQGVAAAPIRPHRDAVQPIGVVCVDSPYRVEKNNWANNQELQRILESLGSIMYALLTEANGPKGKRVMRGSS